MSVLLEEPWTEFLVLITTATVIIVGYFYNTYQYWIRKGVPTIPPRFPLGNTNTFLPQGSSIGSLSKTFYDHLKQQGHKFGGIYLVTTPNMVIVDPDYIRDIMSKDFQHFVDRGTYYNKKDDFLSGHLFSMDGHDWRNLRVKLTPTFTSGKMKMMFHAVIQSCDYMIETIDNNLGEDIEMKDTMARFTTDVIGSVAFGIECNSFKYPDAEFRTIGRRHFTYEWWKSLRAFVNINLPEVAKTLGFKVTTADVRNFFRTIVADTVKMRQESNTRRNDFLQLLMDLKDTSSLTLNEMASQSFVFFVAGFETSSTVLTFALYELAKNPEIQKKLRMEVLQVLDRHNGQLTYENLSEMTYLQQVFDETVRKYPPLPTLNRRCTKNYTLRDTHVVIEKGTSVLISALGLHLDPEHYPEPEIFDPERFNEENKKKRHPFAYLPFGDGPRNCIALRFGLMQSKIGIASIIKNYHLTVSPSTKPVVLNPYTFTLTSQDPVYLRAERL